MDWLAVLRLIAEHQYTAGVLGASLSLRWTDGQDWTGKLFAFGCGVAAFLWVAPMLAEWLGTKATWSPNFCALMCGMFGRHFASKAARTVEKMDVQGWVGLVSDFLTWFRQRDGKGGGKE